ncbi:hypothetical protein ACPWT1_05935 [Ramlibacter sp. MMS24-I3-19]|uniref:hypothetical protein n=1 Tax=Ramlibacter sp. MMS24-I3-19 TaxID=3416606 RepID=UPI003D01EB97
MTRSQAHSIGSQGRNALVALLVVAVHVWLLSVPLPDGPRREALHSSSSPVTVLLIPPADAQSTRAPAAPRPSRQALSSRRMDARPSPRTATSTTRPAPDHESTSPTGPASAAPEAPAQPAHGRGPITPSLPTWQAPPTLAERAQARLEPATGVNPLQRGIESSARPDCKEAYAGLVLLAIPALVRDAFRDDGCKW